MQKTKIQIFYFHETWEHVVYVISSGMMYVILCFHNNPGKNWHLFVNAEGNECPEMSNNVTVLLKDIHIMVVSV
jgi:hypothetical protein